jgi:hypothetical protein
MSIEEAGPRLSPIDESPTTPKRPRILWKWSFFGIVLILGYFAWQCGSGMKAAATLSDDAVRRFHSQLNSQAYDDIVNDADDAFQKSESHDNIVKFLTGVHTKLGASQNSTRTNVFVNATTKGTFIKVTYSSTYEQGNAVETFTWIKANGGLKLVQYNINSNVFVTR